MEKEHIRRTRTFCVFCHAVGEKRDMFKIRDGPLDWYACDLQCAEDFCKWRGDSRVFRLVWQTPKERGGVDIRKEIERVISKLGRE